MCITICGREKMSIQMHDLPDDVEFFDTALLGGGVRVQPRKDVEASHPVEVVEKAPPQDVGETNIEAVKEVVPIERAPYYIKILSAACNVLSLLPYGDKIAIKYLEALYCSKLTIGKIYYKAEIRLHIIEIYLARGDYDVGPKIAQVIEYIMSIPNSNKYKRLLWKRLELVKRKFDHGK